MSKSEEIVAEWLDIVVDSTEPEYHSNLQPFEMYKEKLKAQGLEAFKEYVKTIQKGYELIVDRIQKDQ